MMSDAVVVFLSDTLLYNQKLYNIRTSFSCFRYLRGYYSIAFWVRQIKILYD